MNDWRLLSFSCSCVEKYNRNTYFSYFHFSLTTSHHSHYYIFSQHNHKWDLLLSKYLFLKIWHSFFSFTFFLLLSSFPQPNLKVFRSRNYSDKLSELLKHFSRHIHRTSCCKRVNSPRWMNVGMPSTPELNPQRGCVEYGCWMVDYHLLNASFVCGSGMSSWHVLISEWRPFLDYSFLVYYWCSWASAKMSFTWLEMSVIS